MAQYVCEKKDTVVIEGKEYTVEHLMKTISNYEGVLRRGNEYKKRRKQQELENAKK